MDVVFISGSRADWRLVEPLVRTAQAQPTLTASLVLTGSHLSGRHGQTAKWVCEAGIKPLAEIPILSEADTAANVTTATGTAVIEIGHVLAERNPDWVVVVGDRYESFAGGLAATMLGIPLAHVAGGETDESTNQDGNLRNALSKLAQVHFVANRAARERVLVLGEEPWRVIETGLPSLDQLAGSAGLRSTLEHAGLIPQRAKFALVSFLPVTLEADQAERDLEALLGAFDETSLHKLWVLSNADAGGDQLDARILEWAKGRSDVTLSPALSLEQYATALKHAALYIGNSSSGVIESPIFGTPSIIVGRRQQGRAASANVTVIDVPDAESIGVAIRKALHSSRTAGVSPFGDGQAAPRICKALVQLRNREDLMRKRLIVREVDRSAANGRGSISQEREPVTVNA
jgi:UDP-hydrolysing UDP-N-acetyl-D-glucosamine 2-epimerase